MPFSLRIPISYKTHLKKGKIQVEMPLNTKN